METNSEAPGTGAVLDDLDRLFQMQRYFPQFARDELKNEADWVLRKIWEYLGNDLNEVARNHGRLMHLMRLVSSIDNTMICSFEEKRKLAVRLWDLYQNPNIEGFKKTRVADALATLFGHILTSHVPLSWLNVQSRSSYATHEELIEFGKEIGWRVLFDEIEKRYRRSYRDPVGTSCTRRKARLSSVVQLVSVARAFWDSHEIGQELESYFEIDNTPDLISASIFYKTRVMMLFCSGEYWHERILDGKFWKWWAYLGCRSSSTWDATFARLLFRAVKHGWAMGVPLNKECEVHTATLFHLLTLTLSLPLPLSSSVGFAKESVGGELSSLLDKNFNIIRKLAKIVALLMEPLSGPVPLQQRESGLLMQSQPLTAATSTTTTVWDYLQSFVSILFPLTHPSNNGKWCQPISEFVNAFIQAYTRRVARERMSTAAVRDLVGRQDEAHRRYPETSPQSVPAVPSDGTGFPVEGGAGRSLITTMGSATTATTTTIWSYRLGREEDERVVDLFLPILLQGIYSKNHTAGPAYETAVKRLCYLLPEVCLEKVLDQLMASLETVTETHQLQSSLRLLTQLIPLTVQRLPGILPQLLTLTLPAIDGAEPFKTVQALTFYAVLFSRIGCKDLASAFEADDFPIEEAAEELKSLLFPTEAQCSPLISFQHYPKETLRRVGVATGDTFEGSYSFSSGSSLGRRRSQRNTPDASSNLATMSRKVSSSSQSFSSSAVAPSPSSDTELVNDFWSPAALRDRLSSLLIATSVLPDFIMGLFDQVLRLVTYSTKTDKHISGLMGSIDRSSVMLIKFSVYFIFTECDQIQAELLTQTFLEWVTANVLPDAAKLMAIVARAMVTGRASVCIPILFPVVLKKLARVEISDVGDGTSIPSSPSILKVTPGSTQEQTLLWYLECLSALVRCESQYLRPFESELLSILHWALRHESKAICRFGSKTLRRIIEGSCCVRILTDPLCKRDDGRSETMKEKLKLMNIMRWGHPWWLGELSELGKLPMDPKNPTVRPPMQLQVVWKEPTPDDVAFVKRFVGLGMSHVLQLLRYCIPEELRGDSRATDGTDATIEFKRRRSSMLGDLTMGGLNEEDQWDVPPPHELLIQSQTKLLYRALSLGRKILKGLSALFPDDRKRMAEGFPVVSNIDGELAANVASFLAETCIAVCRCHLGLTVDPVNPAVHIVTPLVELRGVEDCALIKKLLDLMDQLLVRHFTLSGQIHSQSGVIGNLWSAFSAWTSVTSGIHQTSVWQDQGRILWEERLINHWAYRIEQRRPNHPCVGQRRTLLLLVARFGDHYYAENRALAQEILKDAFTCHYGARTKVIQLLVDDLVTETKKLSTFMQTQESPPDIHLDNTSASRSESESEWRQMKSLKSGSNPDIQSTASQKAIGSRIKHDRHRHLQHSELPKEHIELELCYARLTGVTYCLNHYPMLRRIWGGFETVSISLHAICQAFKAPISRDKLQMRLLSLTCSILNYRETLSHEAPGFQKHIVNNLLRPLLSDLQSGKILNWRLQLVATSILIVFNAIPISALEEEYSLWLLTASNPAFHPLLNTIAIFGLSLYLKVQLDKGVQNASPILIDKIHQETSTVAISSCLIHAHHAGCHSGPVKYPESAHQLVVDVVRVDKSWPYSRTARLSRNLSLHNCLVTQTVLEFQYATRNSRRKEEATATGTATEAETVVPATATATTVFLAPWIKQLELFLSQPLGEAEHIVAGCELIGGLIRASALWDIESQRELWRLLFPCLRTALQHLDQLLLLDLLDAFRFGLDPATNEPPSSCCFTPVVNFAIDPITLPDVEHLLKPSTSASSYLSAFESSSTLDVVKRLKLMTAIMLQTRWRVIPLVQAVPCVLQASLFHPYKQIRQETAQLLYVIFSTNADPKTPNDYSLMAQSLTADLLGVIDRVMAFILVDATKTRDLHADRAPELCAAETVFRLVISTCRAFKADAMFDIVLKAVPLAFEAMKHPEAEIASTAWILLCYVTLGFPFGMAPPRSQRREKKLLPPRVAGHQEFANGVIAQLSQQAKSSSWKVRHAAVRLAEILGARTRLNLSSSKAEFSKLISVCVDGLTDGQTEVRNQAKLALSNLAVSLSAEDCHAQTLVFGKLAGVPSQKIAPSSQDPIRVMGGVLGLTALVHSAPYHIPDWLPEAITLLAHFGNSKSSDAVRRQVEQGLQEFFRTHQDAWQQLHVKKFTASQLDILETYKGRPVYFG